MSIVRSRTLFAPAAWLVVTALAGCNLGKAVDKTTRRTLAPGALASSDVPMACALGAAMSPAMLALGHHKPAREPRQAATLTLLAAGMCAELQAWEDELAGIQARHLIAAGADPRALAPLSQDALIRERRHHLDAARRDLGAFERAVQAFGAPTEERECPARLRTDEPLLYLLGLTAGLLAVLHDAAAERALGVSNAIPRQVERGALCLDDDAWWRVPSALRAAVWTAVPGSAPPGVDPWAVLDAAARAGEAEGVWLARALQAQAAAAAGKDEIHRQAIVAHAAARQAGPGAAEVALLNDYAARMITHFSDRLWMEKAGHRTPAGKLGAFPGAAAVDDDAALLDAALAESAGEPAPAAPPN